MSECGGIEALEVINGLGPVICHSGSSFIVGLGALEVLRQKRLGSSDESPGSIL